MEKTLTQKVENEVISKPKSNKALGWFLAGAVGLGALGYGAYKVHNKILENIPSPGAFDGFNYYGDLLNKLDRN